MIAAPRPTRRARLISRRRLIELVLVIGIAVSYALVVTRGGVTGIVGAGALPTSTPIARPAHRPAARPPATQPRAAQPPSAQPSGDRP